LKNDYSGHVYAMITIGVDEMARLIERMDNLRIMRRTIHEVVITLV